MTEETNTRLEVLVDTNIAEASALLSKAERDLDMLNRAADRKYGVKPTDEEFATVRAAIETARMVLRDASKAYTGWSRYYLVRNTGGHIHRDMSCETCFPTTQYGWLVDMSGLMAQEAVEEYGAILCSRCFPSAPVAWTMGENLKERARKDAEAALKAVAKSPEGKKVISATELVRRHEYTIERAQSEIDRLAESAELYGDKMSAEDIERSARQAADAQARIDQKSKLLAKAGIKLAAATDALNAALENS